MGQQRIYILNISTSEINYYKTAVRLHRGKTMTR